MLFLTQLRHSHKNQVKKEKGEGETDRQITREGGEGENETDEARE